MVLIAAEVEEEATKAPDRHHLGYVTVSNLFLRRAFDSGQLFMVIILVDHLVAPCANLTYYWRVFISTLLSFGNGVTGYVEDRGLASRLSTEPHRLVFIIGYRGVIVFFLSCRFYEQGNPPSGAGYGYYTSGYQGKRF